VKWILLEVQPGSKLLTLFLHKTDATVYEGHDSPLWQTSSDLLLLFFMLLGETISLNRPVIHPPVEYRELGGMILMGKLTNSGGKPVLLSLCPP
jgi:hypothetical protein